MKKYNLKSIMRRAWYIRKSAASEIGCKVSEVVWSLCLKQAWSEATAPMKAAESVVAEWRGMDDARKYDLLQRVSGKIMKAYGVLDNTWADTVKGIAAQTWIDIDEQAALDLDTLNRLNYGRMRNGKEPITLVSVIYRVANAAAGRMAYRDKQIKTHETGMTATNSEDGETFDAFELTRADKLEKDICGIARETENIVIARDTLDAVASILGDRDKIDRQIAVMVVQGKSEREIGKAVGMSGVAVHKRIVKMREALRHLLTA